MPVRPYAKIAITQIPAGWLCAHRHICALCQTNLFDYCCCWRRRNQGGIDTTKKCSIVRNAVNKKAI